MIFYDFEVFKYNWLVVLKNTADHNTTVIVDDKEKLENFYNENKEEIWCGFNSRHYDQYILKAILCGFNPKEINDFIIVEKRGGWEFSSLLHKIPLINYDTMTTMHGLKQLEGFLGHNIQETSVPFDIQRPLTSAEIKEVIEYCNHDVEQIMSVFMARIDDFKSHMSLITAFKLPLKYVNKTKPQLSSIILKANKNIYNDEFEFEIVPSIKLITPEYQEVMEWYKNKNNLDYNKELKINVAGVPHIFAWGGIHGAIKHYIGQGIFLNVDVKSYYPSLMIQYNFGSRSIEDPKLYTEIYNTRLKLKAEKNPLQAPYKIVLNSTYGAMKDKYNNLHDPRQANNVCVNGQLMLLDLIEKLQERIKLIQSNTDGILVKLNSKNDLEEVKSICHEWEKRTKMELEYDLYSKVIQKDVNNYIIVDENGNYKSKGSYVKKLNKLDYDLPIVNEAIINYFLNDIKLEDTIYACDNLYKFQKIVRVSSKYKVAWHGKNKLREKTLRVFASRARSDGGIFKQKIGGNLEKVGNTPERCFIENSNISHRAIPRKLDRKWYLDVAQKRVNDILGVS